MHAAHHAITDRARLVCVDDCDESPVPTPPRVRRAGRGVRGERVLLARPALARGQLQSDVRAFRRRGDPGPQAEHPPRPQYPGD